MSEETISASIDSLKDNCLEKHLPEIIRLFDIAEAKIKEVEHLEGQLVIPAVNQLRYVSNHIIRAIRSTEPPKQMEELDKAICHCKRAIFDSTESGIIYLLEKISKFQSDYETSPYVEHVIHNCIDLYQDAQNAREFIDEVATENKDDRFKYYLRCGPHYNSLKRIASSFDIARPRINVRIQDHILVQQKSDRRFTLTIVLSVLGILVAMAAIIVTLFFGYKQYFSEKEYSAFNEMIIYSEAIVQRKEYLLPNGFNFVDV